MTTTAFTDNVTVVAASWLNDVDTAAYSYLSGVAGTDTITATGPTTLTAYAAGQRFRFIPANTNTGATTLAITGATALTAKNVFSNGAACVGAELKASVPVEVMYDGTQFNITGPNLGSKTTWTPALTFATAGDLNVAYTTQVGGYTRIGHLLIAHFNIVTSTFTHGTASGNLRVTGLPATVENTTGLAPVGGLVWQGVTKAGYTQIEPVPILNTTYLEFQASGSAQNVASLAPADMPTGGTVILRGSVAYRV